MHPTAKPLILLALLACAGCAKPSDISEARREHLLAGPHGWIDLTLHAPAAASAPASAPAIALTVSTPHSKGVAMTVDARPNECRLEFIVDGESMLAEGADLAQADAAGNPLGYRFPVPAGALDTELAVSSCVAERLSVKLPLAQARDQLSVLEFDGKALVLKSAQPYAPATLDAVHGAVGRLHERGEATDGTLAVLVRLVAASVVLNLVVLAVLFLRRRR